MRRFAICTHAVLPAVALLLSSGIATAQTPTQPPPAAPPAAAPPSAASPSAGASTPPAPGKKSDDADAETAPWYEHKPWMSKDPAPLPRPSSKTLFIPVSARYDVHSFVSGSVTGAGTALRLAAAIPSTTASVEGFIGIYVPNGAFYGGFSFFRNSRYSFIPDLMKTEDVTVNIASGHFEFGMLGLSGVPFTMNLVGSPAGIRASHCPTHLSADLRPTAGFWGAPVAQSTAFSWGISLNVSYVFSIEPSVEKPKPVEEKPKPKEDEEEQEARVTTTSRCSL